MFTIDGTDGVFGRIGRLGGMMVVVADDPAVELESRWARWMRGNRLGAAIALGLGVGLVWGVTVGVVFAVLLGNGVVGTCELFAPAGLVVGAAVGIAVSKGASSITWSGSRVR